MEKKQSEEKSKAKKLEEFLKFIEECESEHELAFEEVGKEDRRLQDLLHEMEFAPDKAARNRVATKLHNSRVSRRKNKDIVKANEEIVAFCKNNRKIVNEMKELLGKQRKNEDYLNGDRVYKPREENEVTTKLKNNKVLKEIGKH